MTVPVVMPLDAPPGTVVEVPVDDGRPVTVDPVAVDPVTVVDGTCDCVGEALAGSDPLFEPSGAPPIPTDVLPTVVDGAGVTNPLGVDELKVGDATVGELGTLGELIDGGVNVPVVGGLIAGEVGTVDVPVEGLRLPNGCGAGVSGDPGRGMQGAGSVCMAGLGFATG